LTYLIFNQFIDWLTISQRLRIRRNPSFGFGFGLSFGLSFGFVLFLFFVLVLV